MRIDLDVRRVWQCPQCGRVKKTAGSLSAVSCGCTEEGTWMRLVETPRSKPVPPPAEKRAQPAVETTAASPETPEQAAAGSDGAVEPRDGSKAKRERDGNGETRVDSSSGELSNATESAVAGGQSASETNSASTGGRKSRRGRKRRRRKNSEPSANGAGSPVESSAKSPEDAPGTTGSN